MKDVDVGGGLFQPRVGRVGSTVYYRITKGGRQQARGQEDLSTYHQPDRIYDLSSLSRLETPESPLP